MRKLIVVFLILMIGFSSSLQAQRIPKNRNKTDKYGLRQGTWTILYDGIWKIIKKRSKAKFYRIITYKDDKPIGKVRDYYRSGKLQMMVDSLVADRPTDIKEGSATYYFENGNKSQVSTYKQGRLWQDTQYNLDGTTTKQDYKDLGEKSMAAYQKGDYKKAIEFSEQSRLQAKKQIGVMHYDYAIGCYNLAFIYSTVGQYSKSIVFYTEAKDIEAKILGKYARRYLTTCYGLAGVYVKKGKYEKAEALYREVIKAIKGRKEQNFRLRIMSYGGLANVYTEKGDYKKAERFLGIERSLNAEAFGKDHLSYANVCINLGLLYYKQGFYNKAKKLYLEAKNIYENKSSLRSSNYSIILENIAMIYHAQGLYTKAEINYKQARSITREILGSEHPEYATTCNNLADLYRIQGRYHEAEKLIRTAKQVIARTRGIDNNSYAASCNKLAAIYQAQGQYREAEKFYLEAMRIRAKILGRHHSDYAITCNGLAVLYNDKRAYDKAERLYVRAKNTLNEHLGKQHVWYATICNNLATLYQDKNEYRKAEKLLIEAKVLTRKQLGSKHYLYANICNNLGFLYKHMGEYTKAEKLLREAKQVYLKTFGRQHLQVARVNNNVSEVYVIQQKFNKAFTLLSKIFDNLEYQIKKNFYALSETKKQNYLRRKFKNDFEGYNSFAKTYLDSLTIPKSKKVLAQMYNNRLFIKSLLFRANQKTKERIYASGDTSLIDQYEQFIAKRVYYNKMQDLPKKQRKKRGVKLDKLNDEIEALEKNLARKSSEFAQELEEYVPHTWQEVQQKLKRGEAAIEMIRFRWYNKRWTDTVYYVALIVTPESKYPEPVFLTNGNFLEGKAYSFYRNSIQQQTRNTQSYAQFWQPIQQRLQQTCPVAKKVFVSLDGVYHKINLATLWNPQTQQYVGQELAIQLVSNTKDLLKRTEASHPKRKSGVVSLFGYPTYRQYNSLDTLPVDQKLKPLPGTLTSVKAIAKVVNPRFTIQTYTGKAATEEHIKAQKNPQVLHLATHGFFLQDPRKPKQVTSFLGAGQNFTPYFKNPLRRTGLYWVGAEATLNNKPLPDSLENGILTAQEALNLTLDSTDLVVLSACDTGLGEIQNSQGVYGLQRAFLSAGAKYVLMSLWQVDDEATRWFMQYFYESWGQDQNVRKAYELAQERMRKKYQAPYYWGAFVLVSK